MPITHVPISMISRNVIKNKLLVRFVVTGHHTLKETKRLQRWISTLMSEFRDITRGRSGC